MIFIKSFCLLIIAASISTWLTMQLMIRLNRLSCPLNSIVKVLIACEFCSVSSYHAIKRIACWYILIRDEILYSYSRSFPSHTHISSPYLPRVTHFTLLHPDITNYSYNMHIVVQVILLVNSTLCLLIKLKFPISTARWAVFQNTIKQQKCIWSYIAHPKKQKQIASLPFKNAGSLSALYICKLAINASYIRRPDHPENILWEMLPGCLIQIRCAMDIVTIFTTPDDNFSNLICSFIIHKTV